jgi:hypothetical protein
MQKYKKECIAKNLFYKKVSLYKDLDIINYMKALYMDMTVKFGKTKQKAATCS